MLFMKVFAENTASPTQRNGRYDPRADGGRIANRGTSTYGGRNSRG